MFIHASVEVEVVLEISKNTLVSTAKANGFAENEKVSKKRQVAAGCGQTWRYQRKIGI